MTITAIIVASCGAIIPEPLQIPVSVTALPSISTVRDASLRVVSVVMIASATGAGSGPSWATQRGSAATTLSAGKRMPITPVAALATWVRSTPSARAAAASTASVASTPAAPVIALALPLITTIARIASDGSRRSASATQYDRARLIVNTPAHAASQSDTNSATSGLLGRIPAATAAKRNPRGSFTRASRGGRAPSSGRARASG